MLSLYLLSLVGQNQFYFKYKLLPSIYGQKHIFKVRFIINLKYLILILACLSYQLNKIQQSQNFNKNMSQNFQKPPFDSRFHQINLSYQSLTKDRSQQRFGSRNQSQSPLPKKHPILIWPTRRFNSENLYVFNQNQREGKYQGESSQYKLKLDKVPMNPFIQTFRNHHFSEDSSEFESKNILNVSSELQKRYVDMQRKNLNLQHENYHLKKQRDELLLKRQDSYIEAAKLIQDLRAYKFEAIQLRIRFDQMHNKLKESSQKLYHQMMRLQQRQKMLEESIRERYLYAQSAKADLQEAKKANQIFQKEINKILDQLTVEKGKYEQKIKQQNQTISNMGRQIVELKSSNAYNKLMVQIKQKTRKFLKMINLLDPQENFEFMDVVDMHGLKQISIRNKISEQQTKFNSLEKRYNELQKIAEQLYQKATILSYDIRRDVSDRYLAFNINIQSEIAVVRSEHSTPQSIESADFVNFLERQDSFR